MRSHAEFLYAVHKSYGCKLVVNELGFPSYKSERCMRQRETWKLLQVLIFERESARDWCELEHVPMLCDFRWLLGISEV